MYVATLFLLLKICRYFLDFITFDKDTVEGIISTNPRPYAK